VHDISFSSPSTGYAAAELGQVWKTADGGVSWTPVMNLGFPYYWYGVSALSDTDVMVSGFDDSNFRGLIRWSHDGGATWTPDIVLTTSGWSFRNRFTKNHLNALVLDGVSVAHNIPNAAHYTSDGGATAADWTFVVPDMAGGWFSSQFSLLDEGPNPTHVRVSGITYCESATGGASWSCRPSIDSVFDGPVFFTNDQDGWVGGGEISPNVEGWIHRTTDGGVTWSGRVLDGGLPIRELRFITPLTGFAAGGNIYTNIGGIYFTSDGGESWTLETNAGYEMDACDSQNAGLNNFQVWCVGYNSSFNGAVYTTTIQGNTSSQVSSAQIGPLAGDPITFNASVVASDSGIPTGTVDFKDGNTVIAAGQALDAAGTASFSTTALASGVHLITVAYSGDANHSISISPVWTQVVNDPADTATTTMVGSLMITPMNPGQGPNVVQLLQGATLTATITPSPGNNGVVAFVDGASVLAQVPVSGGAATLDLANYLRMGERNIQAIYSGWTGIRGSQSSVLVRRSPRPR